MRFGIVILPQHDWPDAARYWRGAEQLGFDHAWTYDHLSWRSLADEPWHATVPDADGRRDGDGDDPARHLRRLAELPASGALCQRLGDAGPDLRRAFHAGLGSGGTGFDAFVLGQEEFTPRAALRPLRGVRRGPRRACCGANEPGESGSRGRARRNLVLRRLVHGERRAHGGGADAARRGCRS